MNLCHALEQHANQQPETVAIIDGQRIVNYGDLDLLVRMTASHLLELGVQPADRVGICLGDHSDHLIAMLAVARMGGVILPIDWRATASEKAALARGFGARLLLVDANDRSADVASSMALDADWHRAVANVDTRRKFLSGSKAPLLINLSSGTTGVAKEVVVSHEQLLARFTAWWKDLGLERGNRYFSALPLSFSFGRAYGLYSLIGGNTVILHPSLFSTEGLIAAIKSSRASMALFVPTMLRRLLEVHGEKNELLLPDLRYLVSGAAALAPDEKHQIVQRINPNLYEIYGSTGAGVITVLQPEDIGDHAESVGRPSTLSEIEIVDEQDHPVPPDTVGRLRCRGPQVAGTPDGQPNAAPGGEGIRGGWCYTGELAKLDDAGFILLKGRLSEVINSGGFKIHPEEIEAVLLSHPAVAEAAVVRHCLN